MPRKSDLIPIADPFLDRRTKMLPCQKEMAFYWYARGASINGLARMFKVNKRLIQFLLFPERKRKNLADRQERGGWQQYYDKPEHAAATKDHRAYKALITNLKRGA